MSRLLTHILILLVLVASTFSSADSDSNVHEFCSETPSCISVFYSINIREVQNGKFITSPTGKISVRTAGTVKQFYTDEITFVHLLDSSDEIVGLDLISQGLKNRIHFTSHNTALADVTFSLSMMGVVPHKLHNVYARIDSHPKFDALESIFRDSKRFVNNDEAAELSVTIALDIVKGLKGERKKFRKRMDTIK